MEKKKLRVPWYGYVALLITVLVLSGLLQLLPEPWSALDFQALLGEFGKVASVDGGVTNYRGTGGSGPRDAFLLIISLLPAIVLAFGIIEVTINYHGLLAAEKILTPIMRPLLGISGAGAVSLVGNFTSSDIGSATANSLYETGYLTDKERLILVAWQFSAPALVVNFYTLGAAAIPDLTVNASLILLLVIIMKFVGANIFRIYLNLFYKEEE